MAGYFFKNLRSIATIRKDNKRELRREWITRRNFSRYARRWKREEAKFQRRSFLHSRYVYHTYVKRRWVAIYDDFFKQIHGRSWKNRWHPVWHNYTDQQYMDRSSSLIVSRQMKNARSFLFCSLIVQFYAADLDSIYRMFVHGIFAKCSAEERRRMQLFHQLLSWRSLYLKIMNFSRDRRHSVRWVLFL
jgi:hypothetical protein